MNITKTSLKEFRVDFKDAVKELEQKFGVVVDLGSINFTLDGFRGKITVVNNTTGSTEKSSREVIQEMDFKTNASQMGFEASDLGRKFLCQGKTYTIVGSKMRSYKYPILGKGNDGKVFKFRSQLVKNNLI